MRRNAATCIPLQQEAGLASLRPRCGRLTLLTAEQRIRIRRCDVCGSTQSLRPGCQLRKHRHILASACDMLGTRRVLTVIMDQVEHRQNASPDNGALPAAGIESSGVRGGSNSNDVNRSVHATFAVRDATTGSARTASQN
jgi:hypothetical protein